MSERPVKGDVPDEEPIPENLHNQEDKKADADQAKANPDSTSKQGYKQP